MLINAESWNAGMRLERKFVKPWSVIAVVKSVMSCKGYELGLLRPQSSPCVVVGVVRVS